MTKSTITLPHKVKKNRAHVTKNKKLRHLNMIKHGGYAKDPLQTLRSWRRHYPQNARLFDQQYARFNTHFLISDDSTRKEIKKLCVKMVSRDLMMGITVEKDFMMPVPSLGIIRPHFLMKKVNQFDDEIQQQLRNLNLIGQEETKKDKSFLDL
jgi:hypothetical protein